ncbi:sugar phosphate isomerase/epimerase family protein [Alicyclobacillus mali (ex Roth et al. 2021)]|uniref:sugar phosphate isomerase/epimerase family protein n=1 Tax=Alicyclobacillus mali (ex Roth et al. 2021) TaxID=1123961 RepID=UPI001A8ECC4F|nr:sugar phosphate isomerase/epimerase [Alicyclobacillus mali (ex Roth et al. 2021)]
MKWSVCTTGMKERSLEDILKLVRAWRASGVPVDGLELWVGHVEPYAAAGRMALEELASRLADEGLSVPVISGYTYFSRSPRDRDSDLRDVRRYAEMASALGGPAIRTFFGHLPSRAASPELWDESLAALVEARIIAQGMGSDLLVETHYQTFADSLDSLRSLLHSVPGGDLGLIFDAANFNPDHLDPLEVLREVYPAVRHVHCKNYHWNHEAWYQSVPVSAFDPSGDVDNDRVLRELAARGYQGFVSLEYFGRRGFPALLRSLEEARWRSA